MTQFLPRGRGNVINPVESDVDMVRSQGKVSYDC